MSDPHLLVFIAVLLITFGVFLIGEELKGIRRLLFTIDSRLEPLRETLRDLERLVDRIESHTAPRHSLADEDEDKDEDNPALR